MNFTGNSNTGGRSSPQESSSGNTAPQHSTQSNTPQHPTQHSTQSNSSTSTTPNTAPTISGAGSANATLLAQVQSLESLVRHVNESSANMNPQSSTSANAAPTISPSTTIGAPSPTDTSELLEQLLSLEQFVRSLDTAEIATNGGRTLESRPAMGNSNGGSGASSSSSTGGCGGLAPAPVREEVGEIVRMPQSRADIFQGGNASLTPPHGTPANTTSSTSSHALPTTTPSAASTNSGHRPTTQLQSSVSNIASTLPDVSAVLMATAMQQQQETMRQLTENVQRCERRLDGVCATVETLAGQMQTVMRTLGIVPPGSGSN
eukprot:TRINITY_DN68199_c2_g1_i1.p2 TRINITY_DN68199_c2_g1~~TRINITY_DN68199_c2_g1_i1.p2  ORF type:complete len:319 (-),score=41.13 TRINITY_DN68199_c2_g1_i1:1179-2135(-)